MDGLKRTGHGFNLSAIAVLIAVAAVLGGSYLYHGWAPNVFGGLVLGAAWLVALVLGLFAIMWHDTVAGVAFFVCVMGAACLLSATQFMGRGLAYRSVTVVETCTVQDVWGETMTGRVGTGRGRPVIWERPRVVRGTGNFTIVWDCDGTRVSSRTTVARPDAEPGQVMEVARDPRGTLAPMPAEQGRNLLWPLLWCLVGALPMFVILWALAPEPLRRPRPGGGPSTSDRPPGKRPYTPLPDYERSDDYWRDVDCPETGWRTGRRPRGDRRGDAWSESPWRGEEYPDDGWRGEAWTDDR